MSEYRPPGRDKYTSVRMPPDVAVRIERLVDAIAQRTGLRPTTASVVTEAIRVGLPELEARNGLTHPEENNK
jgi:predicted DNA-binding protein